MDAGRRSCLLANQPSGKPQGAGAVSQQQRPGNMRAARSGSCTGRGDRRSGDRAWPDGNAARRGKNARRLSALTTQTSPDQLVRRFWPAPFAFGRNTDPCSPHRRPTGFERHLDLYVTIHLVVLLQIELRVLTKRGPDAHAASLDLPSRLIACSSGRSQSQ
jgi:hypothetical protein